MILANVQIEKKHETMLEMLINKWAWGNVKMQLEQSNFHLFLWYF